MFGNWLMNQQKNSQRFDLGWGDCHMLGYLAMPE
jgi:hypothetical protein